MRAGSIEDLVRAGCLLYSAWCFEAEATAATESLLDRLKTGDAAVVPAHWPAEIARSIA